MPAFTEEDLTRFSVTLSKAFSQAKPANGSGLG